MEKERTIKTTGDMEIVVIPLAPKNKITLKLWKQAMKKKIIAIQTAFPETEEVKENSK